MPSDVASIPGWYGKLPTLGDFASRRLENDFIEPWDLWLGECMQAQRAALGDGWLETYLQSPPWRFLLAPGVLAGSDGGAAGAVFAGVLIPSVDRVGRHFPLTLAASLPRVPRVAAEIDALLGWMHRLEDTALDAVQGQWTIDDLESALRTLAPPSDAAAAAAEGRLAAVRRAVAAAVANGGGFVEIAAVGSRAEFATVFAGAIGAAPSASAWDAPAAFGRTSFWIAEPPGRPRLLVSAGLPALTDFAAMFDGAGVTMPRFAGAPAPASTSTFANAPAPAMLPADAGSVDDLSSTSLGHATIPDDADLLALFDLPAPARETDMEATRPIRNDLFAMLDASAASTAAPSAEAASAPADDILALFDVDTSPGGAAAAGQGATVADPLGLLDDKPAAAAPGKLA